VFGFLEIAVQVHQGGHVLIVVFVEELQELGDVLAALQHFLVESEHVTFKCGVLGVDEVREIEQQIRLLVNAGPALECGETLLDALLRKARLWYLLAFNGDLAGLSELLDLSVIVTVALNLNIDFNLM
jgi:hypothetical protein